MFTIDPAVTSAAVTTYVPTNVHEPPVVNNAHGVDPPVGVTKSSDTTTSVRFAAPVFVAVIVYVNVSPTDTSPEPSSSAFTGAGFTIDTVGVGATTVLSSVTGSD